ncbi:MAG: pilus assembly protein PilO [Cyanomargarita calcarea GSE-NOS-MK-12-04C]|jgi:type IV pilus assembly protein PilO|uniref:Pilus assembly protein PilO n=1 Tax=Cyanomargarita calcarea GSE-NOS-MK-12-04C TaxID=2839659 RepID=A0A951UTM6_9CYAN|nr:pilus assembly protein PilO [Cyanomargarita calcarea GSE-NOS-MK-12-04C]
MTLSEDFNFAEGQEMEAAPAFPVIFGITFTPKIIGILVGVTGLAAAVYMVLNLVMPTWEAFQLQEAKRVELQGQIQQKKASIKQIDKVKQELAQTKQQQAQVLSVFANEKTLDTLLLDVNRLVESGNGLIPANAVRAKLKKFAPANQKPEPINDGSLGVGVNGKLKRSSVSVEIIGTYEQTQAILRNIERLQPLLLVKDYQSALASEPALSDKEPQRTGSAPITTSFQLQALMPLNPEDVAAAAKAAQPAKK